MGIESEIEDKGEGEVRDLWDGMGWDGMGWG